MNKLSLNLEMPRLEEILKNKFDKKYWGKKYVLIDTPYYEFSVFLQSINVESQHLDFAVQFLDKRNEDIRKIIDFDKNKQSHLTQYSWSEKYVENIPVPFENKEYTDEIFEKKIISKMKYIIASPLNGVYYFYKRTTKYVLLENELKEIIEEYDEYFKGFYEKLTDELKQTLYKYVFIKMATDKAKSTDERVKKINKQLEEIKNDKTPLDFILNRVILLEKELKEKRK